MHDRPQNGMTLFILNHGVQPRLTAKEMQTHVRQEYSHFEVKAAQRARKAKKKKKR